MFTESEELTEISLRLEPPVARAFDEYAKRSNLLKYRVLAEAIENLSMLRGNRHLQDPRQKHFLFLKRPKTRGKKIVVGTQMSAATRTLVDNIRGHHSPAFAANEALRIYFQQNERDNAATYDHLKFSKFCSPLHIDLDDVDTSLIFPTLPNDMALVRDEEMVPGRLKGEPVLVDSSYLLGLMIGKARSLTTSSEGNARPNTLLKPLFDGELVLSTTTAQIAELAEFASGIFALRTEYDFKEFARARRGPPISSLTATRLKERLEALQSLGVAIIPVEPCDYAAGCGLARSVWPVSMAKLTGLAALSRITGKTRVSVLSLYRTKTVSPLQVWEHFTDGYCGVISSSDSQYQSYLPSDMVDDELRNEPPPTPTRSAPFLGALHPALQR